MREPQQIVHFQISVFRWRAGFPQQENGKHRIFFCAYRMLASATEDLIPESFWCAKLPPAETEHRLFYDGCYLAPWIVTQLLAAK